MCRNGVLSSLPGVIRCVPPAVQIIKAEIVLWTAGFVLLTLVINAPMLPYVLRWTGLSKGKHPNERA